MESPDRGDLFGDDDDDDERGRRRSWPKLAFITMSYGLCFVSLVQLGLLLIRVPEFHPLILPTDIISKWEREQRILA
jgi:hypothetical protein